MKISNYDVVEHIYEGTKSDVYRCVEKKDKKNVIIKTMKYEYPTQKQLARFRHQYEITKNLNIFGIIRPSKLIKHNRGFALVMEDIGGVALSSVLQKYNDKKLDLNVFLSIAIKITSILGEIHKNNIIHKDIKPDNIVVSLNLKRVMVIDFGCSTLLSQENQSVLNPSKIEGTLSYLSPEQTGRMNRVIDYRTDFYSLGVTFYELLTGKLPFEAEDAMGIVHMHMAKQAILPSEADPRIPEMISKIVMKLLAKSPENRYQSAFGLKNDLEKCLGQHERGSRKSFLLGKNDFSNKFQVSQKLYGRDKEINRLMGDFEKKVCAGFSQIIMIYGYSGIGKSVLIHEIHKPIIKHRGYFISGKFDNYKRNIPYSAIIQAFQELVKQILTDSDEIISIWKEKLLKALGPNGQIIVSVIPEVELIIGKQPNVPELGLLKTQNRFNLVFQNFIKVFSRKEHPLVLFLDDLQWADLSTLNLIKLLILDSEIKYLFIIGAYRDNEVSPYHALLQTLDDLKKEKIRISEINLGPLTSENIVSLIADSLNTKKIKVKELSSLIEEKTNGNPFFVNEFLKTLYQENKLVFDFDKGNWEWNLLEIKKMDMTDNVVNLMTSKIKKISENSQNVLKLASCIGNKFDLRLLSIVNERESKETAEDLWEAIKKGLIFPLDNSYKYIHTDSRAQNAYSFLDDFLCTYRFSHDRIQQAAYSILEEDKKKKIHLRIGRLLLKNTGKEEKEEKLFNIVNHYNEGIDLIYNTKEKRRLAELNLKAGIRAKKSIAYFPAFKYFKMGIKLIGLNCWENYYDLTFSLYIELIETAYLCSNYEEMELLSKEAFKYARSTLDMARIYKIKIHTYTAQNKLIEAVKTGLEILELMGVKFPKKVKMYYVLFNLIKTKIALRGKRPEDLVSYKEMKDPKVLKIIEILGTVATAAYWGAPKLLPILVFKMIRLAVKYGNHAMSPYNYAGYGLILCSINRIEQGYRFGMMSLELLENMNIKEQEPRTQFVVNTFIRHWKEHMGNTLEPIMNAYKRGMEVGDLEFASFSLMEWSYRSYYIGRNLKMLKVEILKHIMTLKKLKQETQLNTVGLFYQIILNLLQKNGEPYKIMGEFYDETKMLPIHLKANDHTILCLYYINKLMLCFLFQEYQLAIENADKTIKILGGVAAVGSIAVFYFFDSLTRIAVYRCTNGKMKRQKLMNRVLRNRKKIKLWVKYAAMNNLHKLFLIDAELARIKGDVNGAMNLYDKAIELARKNDYTYEEAISNELAADFFIERGNKKIAILYVKEAYYCYFRWGAVRKIRNLEGKYSDFFVKEKDVKTSKKISEQHVMSMIGTSTSTSSTKVLDLGSVIKAYQALAGEIVLKKLLKKMIKIVMENAGAERGILILEKNSKYKIEAEGQIENNKIKVMQSIPLAQYDEMPLSIIKYVIRTRESIVIDEVSLDKKFSQNEYLKNNKIKSLLCSPVMHQGNLIALLYLENSLTTDVFTKNRLQIIKYLSSQIAVSIENARLYENLKEQERLKGEMEIAEKIQTAIVPEPPKHKDLEIAVALQPTEEVGGDYYDVLFDNQGNIWFAIGDVSGHGVTPGLIMMMAQTAFSVILNEKNNIAPKDAIIVLNKLLYQNIKQRLKEDHFMTMFFVKYLGKGNFVSAGSHLDIIVYRNEIKRCELIRIDGVYLGIILDISNVTENLEFKLNKNDIMLLYTDGIIEARQKSGERKFFGLTRLQEIFINNADKSVEKIKSCILKSVLDWCANEPNDDIAMVVTKRK